jgi:hypothetical protein
MSDDEASEPMMLAIADGAMSTGTDQLSSVTKLGGRPTFMKRLTDDDSGVAGGRVPAEVAAGAVCGTCATRMFLLAQCYCPLADGHNRMMYVFCCNRSACCALNAGAGVGAKKKNWRCVTVQCDSEDAEAEDDEEDHDDAAGPQSRTREPFTPFAFPPVATYVDAEPMREAIVQTEQEKRIEAGIQDVGEEDLDSADEAKKVAAEARVELEGLEREVDLKNKVSDESFEAFRHRVARCPAQVLRYQPNGAPVYMNAEKCGAVAAPPCERCGGARSMELQVMPTSLYFLHVDRHVPAASPAADAPKKADDGVDFGTVTVLTCAAQCGSAAPGVVVREEILLVEDAPAADDARAGGKISMNELANGPNDAEPSS